MSTASPYRLYSRGLIGLALRDKVWIIRQIADALACIHSRHICHHEIKPDNILILPDLTIKPMDFGIARFPGSELTQAILAMGTPAYIAPEGFVTGKADQQADLFSLGSVAYKLFIGQLPFTGESQVNFGNAIQFEKPYSPRRLNPEFPAALENLPAKLLKKRPGKRYASGLVLVEGLDLCLAGDLAHLSPFRGYQIC